MCPPSPPPPAPPPPAPPGEWFCGGPGAPGRGGGVAQLAHDPLEAHGAGLLEDERRLDLEVLSEVEAIGLRLLEQGREDALALDERRLPQIEAVEVEQVEGEVDHALGAARGEIGLQGVEVGNARLALHDHLAIENEVVGRQIGQGAGERGEPGASSRTPAA